MTEPHLDDDQISALLDGEADSGAGAHLSVCPSCRSRSESFDAVRRALAVPPPPAPPAVADRAVSAAMGAWDDQRAGGVVVPMPPLHQRPPTRRPRVPRWAMAVAAAGVAAAVAVPLTVTGDGGRRGDQTASAPTERAGDERTANATADGDSVPVVGGDLGDQSDPETLGQVVRQALSGPAASESAPPIVDGSDSATGGRSTSLPAATAARDGSGRPAPTAQFGGGPPPCTAEVASTYGAGLGALVYSASLRWKGTPAVLLAYQAADAREAGLGHRGFVMALDGCRLLVVQAF